MKTCIHCEQEKPFSEFYIRSGKPDDGKSTSYYSVCKVCQKAATKYPSNYPKSNSGDNTEHLMIDELLSHGIFASTGKYISAKYVDVVAWGCVWIEVKGSQAQWNYRKDIATFKFNFTAMQRKRGVLADIIALVCEFSPTERTFHLFHSNDPVFYRNGQLMSTVKTRTYTHFKKVGINEISSQKMDETLSQWNLIEYYRYLDPRRRLKTRD